MKAVILAGGYGSRLLEETLNKPKALVEIGGRPILWHIMNYYARFDVREFIVALGYKGWAIKQYMRDFGWLRSDTRVDLSTGKTISLDHGGPPWLVDLVDTGDRTSSAGRIKRLRPHLGDSTFMLTWCDGLSDIDLAALVAFHESHSKLATVTAVRPPARFGVLKLDGDRVEAFAEKPVVRQDWINGAFFVLEPGALDYIEGDDTSWEKEPMENMAKDGQLMAFRHEGFWQCMDTPQDKALLEDLWESGRAPWTF